MYMYIVFDKTHFHIFLIMLPIYLIAWMQNISILNEV